MEHEPIDCLFDVPCVLPQVLWQVSAPRSTNLRGVMDAWGSAGNMRQKLTLAAVLRSALVKETKVEIAVFCEAEYAAGIAV